MNGFKIIPSFLRWRERLIFLYKQIGSSAHLHVVSWFPLTNFTNAVKFIQQPIKWNVINVSFLFFVGVQTCILTLTTIVDDLISDDVRTLGQFESPRGLKYLAIKHSLRIIILFRFITEHFRLRETLLHEVKIYFVLMLRTQNWRRNRSVSMLFDRLFFG